MSTLQPSRVTLVINDTLKWPTSASQKSECNGVINKGYDWPPISISSNCIRVNRMDRYLHHQPIRCVCIHSILLVCSEFRGIFSYLLLEASHYHLKSSGPSYSLRCPRRLESDCWARAHTAISGRKDIFTMMCVPCQGRSR